MILPSHEERIVKAETDFSVSKWMSPERSEAEIRLVKAYQEIIADMTNAELWEAFLDATYPDDYDGGFTDIGIIKGNTFEQAIKDRLADWLKR